MLLSQKVNLMARYAEAPLKKVTFNIFVDDYNYLISRYEQGYTEMLRAFIKLKVRELKQLETDHET